MKIFNITLRFPGFHLDEVLTAVVLKGLRESEKLPLLSASRQELQLQQPAAGRPVPFPSTPPPPRYR
jgi:hypothetical protein